MLYLNRANITHAMSDEIYTIEQAAKDYIKWFKLHRKSLDRTLYLINAHILPILGHIEVSELTTIQIREWQEELVKTPRRKRTSTDKMQEYLEFDNSEDAFRKRKATANRILNTLKAILNKVYYDGLVDSNDSWKRIKPFRRVDKPRTEYLEIEEINSLVVVAKLDLKTLISAALYTGCRYGELTQMRAEDFSSTIMKLYVRPSKNGMDRYVVLTTEAAKFFTRICKDKSLQDLIFTRSNGDGWGRSHQQRPLKEALKKAGIEKNVSFHSFRHTHASQLAMRGVPMQIIARQLGHADTRTAERHYAHLAPDYIADTIRANFPELGIS